MVSRACSAGMVCAFGCLLLLGVSGTAGATIVFETSVSPGIMGGPPHPGYHVVYTGAPTPEMLPEEELITTAALNGYMGIGVDSGTWSLDWYMDFEPWPGSGLGVVLETGTWELLDETIIYEHSSTYGYTWERDVTIRLLADPGVYPGSTLPDYPQPFDWSGFDFLILEGRQYNTSGKDVQYYTFEGTLSGHRDIIPEPATTSLIGLGLAAMAARKLRRRSR